MLSQTTLFLMIQAAALVSFVHAGSVGFTSYYEGDCCSGTPTFIYEANTDNCEVSGCTTFTMADNVYSTKVDCHDNKREDTAAIYSDAKAPYVLMEEYDPPTGCDNFVNALAFYADGNCRVLPDITIYTSAIASVNADLSVELQIFSDAWCSDVVSNVTIASTDVEWTCFVGYSDSYGLVYYTTDSANTEC